MNSQASQYNALPYPSTARKYSHPFYLRSAAALSGFSAPSTDNCRVLEIGCSDAGNIINMALTMPSAHFFGVDISSREIESGQASINAIGLRNITLKTMDIMELDKYHQDPFDYIVAHGIFSWVPDFIRHKILEICRDMLSPTGVAFISYNTYPGFRLRESAHDIARYAARNSESLVESVDYVRKIINTTVRLNSAEHKHYASSLQRESAMMLEVPDSFVAHDILEVENRAFYFHEFTAKLASFGLEHFSDSTIDAYRILFPPEPMHNLLAHFANNLYIREQQIDLLVGRQFRESLVCHAGVSGAPNIYPSIVESMYITSRLTIDKNFASSENEQIYKLKSGKSCLVERNSILSFILELLQDSFPAPLSPAEICISLKDKFPDITPKRIAEELLECYRSMTDSIEFLADAFPASCPIDDFPFSSPVARFQVQNGLRVTSLYHETVEINPFQAMLLCMADGSRHKSSFGEELIKLFDAGELDIDGAKDALREEITAFLHQAADDCLLFFAKNALLLQMTGNQ